MTSTLRAVAVAAASTVLLLTLAACSSSAPEPTPSETDALAVVVVDGACATDDTGVTVAVDASALPEGEAEEWCVSTGDTIAAADALTFADVQTEGTDEYGDQVVCRVNGLPAEDVAIPAEDGSDYFETCESMPAAFAYWSLWLKPAGGEWGYAEEGLSTLQLEPGDAVELLFTLNGEPAAPAS